MRDSRRSFLRAAGALAAAPLVSRLPRPSRAASQFDPDFGSASEALEAMARGAISSRENSRASAWTSRWMSVRSRSIAVPSRGLA